jgi:stage V sporulation protein G
VTAVVRLHKDGKLLGFADLRVDGFELRGLRVLQGKEGPYVTFPTRQSSGGGFFEVVRPLTPKAREDAKAAVLRAYKRAAR